MFDVGSEVARGTCLKHLQVKAAAARNPHFRRSPCEVARLISNIGGSESELRHPRN